MKATVEISMYPLSDDYLKHVDAFIKSLYKYDFEIHTSYSSTLIVGDYDELMNGLSVEIKKAFQSGKASFVFKLLPGDLRKDVDLDGYQ